jgi:predicted DNA-binding WGR domain protein
MTPRVYLTRTDATRNMARYYLMSVQATLFGEWSLVREWGRIGRAGQVRATTYPKRTEAEQAMEKLYAAKMRKGYY